MEKPEPKTQTLQHQTGVNKEGKPFVQLLLSKEGQPDQFITQMSPADCREHALAMLEAAEAAEQDAFFVWFLREKLESTLEQAGQILMDFRVWREKQTGIQTGMKIIPPGHSKGQA
jgi:hypothetical protein